MNDTDDAAHLAQSFQSSSTQALQDTYASWSNAYDREILALGYCLPFVIAGWIARHVRLGEGPILDAGCGTGLSGPYLAALGFDRLEGLDMSPEMLAIAAGRGCYRHLTQGVLGDTLPFADGHFRAVFATGVFTEGHAPASSLDELLRITRPGGHLIFTIRNSVLEKGGFASRMALFSEKGLWRLVETSPDFRSFAVAQPDVLVRTHVYERLDRRGER